MKNVPCLTATLFLGAALTAGVQADQPKDQVPSASEILSLQDPDGTPYVISHPSANQPTSAEIAAQKKQAQQDAANKDWLLRSYEEQLRKSGSSQAGGESDNLYLRLASDKNLSKLAGVSDLSASPADTAAALRTGGKSNKTPVSLRPDPSVTSTSLSKPNPTSTSAPLLKPLIMPLGAADAAGLHNFYGIKPSATPAPAAKKNDTTRISADLDMPGQVAAKNDSLTKASLTFDSLPDENVPASKRALRADASAADLPLATNEARLQKLNNAALIAPGSAKTVTPVNNVAVLKLNLANESEPLKLTPPSPVRQPISSPYSILDR